jgi:hypothetical protein
MSKLVKKFRKGNYDDDNYYSDEEYGQKKKVRKDKQRKLKYYDDYETQGFQPRQITKTPKFKSY